MIDDLSLYVNFVLHAVYGRLSEADQLLRSFGPSIRRVADSANVYTQRAAKVEASRPIYRGVMLDPDKPFKLDPTLMFLSWSEDPDVARWFATPASVINEHIFEHAPFARGYVFTLEAPRSRVLFHHSWVWLFNDGDLASLALRHPFMGREGQRQIEWSLRTQREVITEPCAMPEPEPIDDFPGSPLHELDARYSPPWIAEVA